MVCDLGEMSGGCAVELDGLRVAEERPRDMEDRD